MRSIFGVAESGLQVSSLRLAVSANNVANALTPGFSPSRVEFQEISEGGVIGLTVKADDPATESRIDQAILSFSSRTDLGQEMIDQVLSAAAFRTNLATLRTADEMMKELVESKPRP